MILPNIKNSGFTFAFTKYTSDCTIIENPPNDIKKAESDKVNGVVGNLDSK